MTNPIPDDLIQPKDIQVLTLYQTEWKAVIDQQNHFNDLILKFRTSSLTTFSALLALVLGLKEFLSIERTIILAIGLIPLAFIIAAGFLDFFYYCHLLIGAVNQADKYDSNPKFVEYGLFGLTTNIIESVGSRAMRASIAVYYLALIMFTTVLYLVIII